MNTGRAAALGEGGVADAGGTVGEVAVDHLVVAARTLADGVAWCEATFGMAPEPGGEHEWMGTHNRLLNIASERFPRAYLEIIAINPLARTPQRKRWFDLDQPALQNAIAAGPGLIHWVARCNNARAASAALRAAGIERGELVPAQRQTPTGLLHWQITVRDDGQRLFAGALPTLIEWGGVHPTDTLPNRGVALTRLAVNGLPTVFVPWLPSTIEPTSAANDRALRVTLATRRGPVVLNSLEISPDHVQP